ncbi:MAG TPA: hypothetical protein VGM64_17400 [Lacunisphaera sp.]|jgi:hypothetical protein
MIRYAYWAATLAFLILVGAKFDRVSGFSHLLRFGETWKHAQLSTIRNLPLATVAHSAGYDGQFYAQIATDPLLRNPELDHAIDAPAYRARRILLPAIAALIGAGNPWWTVQAYALLNIVCWLILAVLIRQWISRTDWIGFARWLACMFSMGVLESARQSLVDLPALIFLAVAIQACAQSIPKSALWLALGNLTKETTLIGTLALNCEGLKDRRKWGQFIFGMIIAVLPLGIWWLYVDHRFNAPSSSEGWGNLNWPFVDMVAQGRLCLEKLLKGNFDGRYSFGLLAIMGLVVQSITLWCLRDFKSPWWRVGAAYALLLPFLGLWIWSGYWAACRAVLPLTIAFNLLLPANRRFWPLWITGNLTMLHAVWRFL